MLRSKTAGRTFDSYASGLRGDDFHSTAWTLLALSRWAVAIGNQDHDDAPTLRLVHDDLAT